MITFHILEVQNKNTKFARFLDCHMALRQEINSKQINGCRASFHVDTGGPVGSDHFVTVEPQSDDEDWFITRWFYFDEENERYAWNFAEKVCTNEEYRQESREENTDWARTANLYETYSRRLYNVLSEDDRSAFPIMNEEESDQDKNVLYDCCESLFKEFKSIVRDGVDKHPEKVFEDQKDILLTHLESKT